MISACHNWPRSIIRLTEKVEFTALKRSLETADSLILTKKHYLPVLTLMLSGCSNFFYDECLWVSKQQIQNTSSKGEIISQIHPCNCNVFCHGREMIAKWTG